MSDSTRSLSRLADRHFGKLLAAWLLSYIPWGSYLVHRLLALAYCGRKLSPPGPWFVVGVLVTALLLGLLTFASKEAPDHE